MDSLLICLTFCLTQAQFYIGVARDYICAREYELETEREILWGQSPHLWMQKLICLRFLPPHEGDEPIMNNFVSSVNRGVHAHSCIMDLYWNSKPAYSS